MAAAAAAAAMSIAAASLLVEKARFMAACLAGAGANAPVSRLPCRIPSKDSSIYCWYVLFHGHSRHQCCSGRNGASVQAGGCFCAQVA